MPRTTSQLVFVQKSSLTCIDTIRPDGTSFYMRETLEQIQARYPGAEIMDLEAFTLWKEEQLLASPVTEITGERYTEMLEVLPPLRWVQRDNGDASFEMSENFCGRITYVNCRVRAAGRYRYFTFLDRMGTTHDDRMARCRAYIAEHP